MDGIVGIFILWAVIGLISSGLKKAKKAAKDAEKAPAPKPMPAAKPSVWEQIEMMGMLPKDDEPEQETLAEAKDEGLMASGSITDYVPLAASQEGLMSPGSIAAAAGEAGFAASASAKAEEKIITAMRVSSRDMKSAVVMAEILSRPLAMRQPAGTFQRRRCGV